MRGTASEYRNDSNEKGPVSRTADKARKDGDNDPSLSSATLKSVKPVASMTGFALATATTPLGPLSVEIRSVNSRFLDLGLRYPDDLRTIEQAIRETVGARITRGKVDCRIGIARAEGDVATALDQNVLSKLASLAAQARTGVPDAAPLSVADVLAWPGVIDAPVADPEALKV
ncbi:MAG: YicC/YloC family endoribonuclease, partial [Burkholderiaceae bacterium]